MANSISLNQSVTTTIDGNRSTLSSNINQDTTSSNFVNAEQDIGSAAWTQLTLGTLSNVLALSIQNDDTVYTASVITIATGSAGGNIIAILPPGWPQFTSWGGLPLNGLYAKVTSGYGGVSTPASASVVWSVQQS